MNPKALPPNAETYDAYTRAERVATVGSSATTQIAYDPGTGHCFVTWRGSGDTYCYESIGPALWEQFKTSDSKGRFANGVKAAGYTCRGPLL